VEGRSSLRPRTIDGLGHARLQFDILVMALRQGGVELRPQSTMKSASD